MEMLRTVIVALFFAGITVCSYYFLSSSPFPWENEETLTAQTDSSGKDTRNEKETPRTFAQDETIDSGNNALAQKDSPFAAPVGNESDEFGALELETLSAPKVQEKNENLVSDAPVLDSDLPSLGSSSGKSPFEMAPEAIPAAPEARVGAELNSQTLPVNTDLPPGPELVVDSDLPASSDFTADARGSESELPTNADLPPGPELIVDSELLPSPESSSVSESSTDLPSVSSMGFAVGGVSNPLRNGESSRIVSTAENPRSIPSVSEPEVSVSAESATSAADSDNSADAQMVREYLKIAAEKIQQGAALEVLKSLSKFYGDARFSAEELAELTNILVQAATQVIYSQKHLMEPAYVVRTGDSLDKIAAEYQIPAEFIARVNGLTAPFELVPGQELKVIRGPFQAIVYLDRHEMILTLKGLFAGRFWIGVGGELVRKDGDFCFGQRVQTPAGMGIETSYEFLRQAGVPGCCDLLKIEIAKDPNQIGADALSGNILMSQLDVDCLGALLGTGSQLIMRCESPKCIAKPVADSDSGVVPAAVHGSSVGAVGNQASMSNAQTSGPISQSGTAPLQRSNLAQSSDLTTPTASASNTGFSPQLGNLAGSGDVQNSAASESGSLDSLPASLDTLPGTAPASDSGYDMTNELPASL